MSLSLTVLGCSGSYPGVGSAASGYLVQGGGVSVWLDTGSGTLANLQRHVDIDRLDAVVISHAHPDHWVDVLSYHIVVKYIRERRGIPVFSPAEVRRLVGEVNGELAPWLVWTDVGDGSRARVGALSFVFSRTDHPGETLAVRIDSDDGASIGYSADTGPGWSMASLGPGLGLALCEATLAPEREGTVQHLTAAQAGADARTAGAKRLVLTHLQPGVDADRSQADATAAFGGPVDLAATGACFEVT